MGGSVIVRDEHKYALNRPHKLLEKPRRSGNPPQGSDLNLQQNIYLCVEDLDATLELSPGSVLQAS